MTRTELVAPDVPGARWPDLEPDGRGGVGLLWTLPGRPNRLEFALARDGAFGPVTTVARGEDWFVNWADFPRLAFAGGDPVVTWLEKLGEGTFAYGVRVKPGDAPAEWLHDDTSATEHGFVSPVTLADGALFAAWLDGRAMADGGPMALRARVLGGPEFELDGRVCECCHTDAALLADGRVLVAWRDKGGGDPPVRDVAWTVGDPRDPDSFAPPRPVHDDRWRVPGCPVNGPAVAAVGDGAAIAWFTRDGEGRGLVRAAFAGPGAAGFDPPVRVDDGRGAGRVDACPLGEHLLVTWLEEVGAGAEWRARLLAPDGRRGPSLAIARVSGERADGFLRLAPDGDAALAAYRDAGEDRVRVARIAVGLR